MPHIMYQNPESLVRDQTIITTTKFLQNISISKQNRVGKNINSEINKTSRRLAIASLEQQALKNWQTAR